MEQPVTHHAKVRAALMVGTGRFQPALFIEPASSQPLSLTDEYDLIKDLYTRVEEANQDYKIRAGFSTSHTSFTDPKHPI